MPNKFHKLLCCLADITLYMPLLLKTRKIEGFFYGGLFTLETILEKSQTQGKIELNEEMHS